MGARSVVQFTTGAAGSGKTYARCAVFILNHWLPEEQGVHYSNFPIRMEGMVAAAMAKHGIREDVVRDRVQVIPEAELEAWRKGTSGPWIYFEKIDLTGGHVAIDEVHNYCGRNSKAAVRQLWQQWLGELRHRGATIEFMSQSPRKVAKEIEAECEVRLEIVNSELRRDPLCGVLLGDLYELRAGLITGEYSSRVWQVEYHQVLGKWKEQDRQTFCFDSELFGVYDSYSKPQMGGVASTGKRREFERRTKGGLVRWFMWRNWWRLALRVLLVGLMVWLFMGGGKTCMAGVMGVFPKSPGSKAAGAKRPVGVVSRPVEAVPPRVGPVAVEVSGPVPPVASSQPTSEEVQELAKLRAELVKLRKEAEGGRVALLTRDTVTFKRGWCYRVGDVIDVGTLRGERIVAIDWGRRAVRLSGGRVLYMEESIDGSEDEVGGVVPDGGRVPSSQPTRGPVRGVVRPGGPTDHPQRPRE